jgi:hypothetical protein
MGLRNLDRAANRRHPGSRLTDLTRECILRVKVWEAVEREEKSLDGVRILHGETSKVLGLLMSQNNLRMMENGGEEIVAGAALAGEAEEVQTVCPSNAILMIILDSQFLSC